jgi:hypothetical protein
MISLDNVLMGGCDIWADNLSPLDFSGMDNLALRTLF